MADYGMLGGLAEGLKQGLLTYNQVKQQQQDAKYKEQEMARSNDLYQLGLLKEGYKKNEAGALELTPEELEKRNTEKALKARKSKIEELEAAAKLSDSGLIPEYDQAGGLIGAKPSGMLSPKKYKESLELRKLEQELGGPQGQFKNLPEESKKQIDTLSTKTASKKAINNQIKAALTKLQDKNVSEDQKIVLGRSLLKTLNSAEGADAIGAEEAKRLGGLLEYKFGNFTQPGSFIGRDLGEFETQVKLTSEALDSAIKGNEAEVDKLYGREPKGQIPTTKNIGGKIYKKVKGGWQEVIGNG